MSTLDLQGVVSTAGGLLRGGREEGVAVFRGVPFARPPVGPLRFRSPQAPEPWAGVRDATRAATASYQVNFANVAAVSGITEKIDPGVPGSIAGPRSVFDTYCHNEVSEDCLYLDVWVPDAARQRPVPVFVYYHGGANMVSSGSFWLERAANLAREAEIVVVRPNYRLGALAWVHFGLLDAGLPEAVNLGVQDQFAALRWVHENVAAFGGDPENVTIGGESAGATAVSHLLANPAAHPHFRRAVLQSFSPFNPWCTQQREEAVVVAEQYLALLGIADPAELQEIDPDRLIAAQSVMARYFPPDDQLAWRPLGAVVDGDWVPRAPAVSLSQDAIDKPGLEVAIGFAKDEWQFFRGHTETVREGSREDVLRSLEQLFGADGAARLFERYQELYPDHAPGTLLSDIMSFQFFKLPSLAVARNLSAQGVPVRLFQFAYDLPGLGGQFGATHTGDMPFLWRNYTRRDLEAWPYFEGVGEQELRDHQESIANVSARIGALYESFIRSGDPGAGWPRFDEDDWNILWFGDSVETRPALLRPEWDLFEALGCGSPEALERALLDNTREAIARAIG